MVGQKQAHSARIALVWPIEALQVVCSATPAIYSCAIVESLQRTRDAKVRQIGMLTLVQQDVGDS